MRLPAFDDPEGLFLWLLGFVLVSSLVFLALFAAGIWSA
jgi:hypothetical protein